MNQYAVGHALTRRELLNYVWLGSKGVFLTQVGGAMVLFGLPRFKAGEFGGVFDVGTSASLRAQLGVLMHTIGDVVFVERANYPTESEIQSVRQAHDLPYRIISFADAQAQLPFAIHLPTWVPKGFERREEVMVALPQAGTLPSSGQAFTLAIVTWCDRQSEECLRFNIEHAPNGSNEWIVGAESIEEIEINGSKAALVRGAWDGKQEAWQSGEVITLSWPSSQPNVTYHLMASEGAEPISALVRMAESVERFE